MPWRSDGAERSSAFRSCTARWPTPSRIHAGGTLSPRTASTCSRDGLAPSARRAALSARIAENSTPGVTRDGRKRMTSWGVWFGRRSTTAVTPESRSGKRSATAIVTDDGCRFVARARCSAANRRSARALRIRSIWSRIAWAAGSSCICICSTRGSRSEFRISAPRGVPAKCRSSWLINTSSSGEMSRVGTAGRPDSSAARDATSAPGARSRALSRMVLDAARATPGSGESLLLQAARPARAMDARIILFTSRSFEIDVCEQPWIIETYHCPASSTRASSHSPGRHDIRTDSLTLVEPLQPICEPAHRRPRRRGAP